MLCTVAASQLCFAQPSQPVEARLRVYPLEVHLNGAPVGIWPIVERDGKLFAPPEAFEAWRMQRQPEAERLEYKGLTYFPLASVPGAEFKLDTQQNILLFNVRSEAFTSTQMKREAGSGIARDPVLPSLFLNYDIDFTRLYSRGSPATNSLGMLGELGYSSRWGLLTNTFAARNLLPAADSQRKLVRLETTLRRDFPDQGYTLNLGDSTTRAGYLGRPAFFGGLQFGSNFGLAPNVNRQPVPILLGQTLAPSTVQLYVNDVLRQTSRVPAGPFTLDTIPPVSGPGQVSVVVRDILGRETVITQPFFVSADLLAPGLNDWSVELGKLRKELGNASFDYGDPFASGVWRRGISNVLTVEGRADVSRPRSGAGAAAVWAIGGNFVARGGLMASRDEFLGSGRHASFGVDWQGGANSALVNAENNSRGFRYLGEDRTLVPIRTQVAAQAAFLLGKSGQLGMGLAVQYPYDAPRITTVSANYSVAVKANWQLNVTVSKAFGPATGTTVGVMISIPLDRRNTVTGSAQVRQGRLDTYASVSHTPAGAYGTAWRVLGGYQGQPRAEANIYHFGPHGIASGEISATSENVNLRLGATGGLLYTAGKAFALPRHDMSAALVEVPGYGGVGVGLGNQVSTRTDAAGYALVPTLNPYQSNPIRLDPNDLPVTAEIDSIELPAVPSWRSVSHITFPIRGGRAAMIQVVFDDAQPAPTGAKVRIEGEERDFYVGRRGEAYVTGLKASNRLKLAWKGASCDLQVELPPGTADEIARVGPASCRGVSR